jgi:hypothetical protein
VRKSRESSAVAWRLGPAGEEDNAMATSRKKVLLRDLSGKVQPGHLPLQNFVRLEGKPPANVLDLLDLEARVLVVPVAPLKWIAWVRDWNLNDRADPEHLTRKLFLARPRSEGLWVRIGFADGDTLEGLAPLDLTLLDGIDRDRGIFLLPPDIRANTQRVYVPRSAMKSLEVLAVITTPSKRPNGTRIPGRSGNLFTD